MKVTLERKSETFRVTLYCLSTQRLYFQNQFYDSVTCNRGGKPRQQPRAGLCSLVNLADESIRAAVPFVMS